eukprot:6191452-Pleurochrysis_carterae.AAC.2
MKPATYQLPMVPERAGTRGLGVPTGWLRSKALSGRQRSCASEYSELRERSASARKYACDAKAIWAKLCI